MVAVYDPQTTPVLDAGTLEQLVDLDDGALGLIQEMFQLFHEDTPGRIQALRITVQEGTAVEMAEIAHAVKGASSTMGANRVRAVAAALEHAGRKSDRTPEELAELVIQLQDTFDEAVAGIRAYIAERS